MAERQWTVTLLANGIRQRVRIADLGTHVLLHSMDFEGRIVRHDYRYIAVDEPRRMATALYEKSHVVKKRARKTAA